MMMVVMMVMAPISLSQQVRPTALVAVATGAMVGEHTRGVQRLEDHIRAHAFDGPWRPGDLVQLAMPPSMATHFGATLTVAAYPSIRTLKHSLEGVLGVSASQQTSPPSQKRKR